MMMSLCTLLFCFFRFCNCHIKILSISPFLPQIVWRRWFCKTSIFGVFHLCTCPCTVLISPIDSITMMIAKIKRKVKMFVICGAPDRMEKVKTARRISDVVYIESNIAFTISLGNKRSFIVLWAFFRELQ